MEEGLLEKTEAHLHSVGHCQRCRTVVEPLVSVQWFMNVGRHDDPDSIAGRAYESVVEGRIRIVPERFGRVYLNWLENIRDWVHQPGSSGGATASRYGTATTARARLWMWKTRWSVSTAGPNGSGRTRTFLIPGSAPPLWPHSTLGWPDETDDLRLFYPRTGHVPTVDGYDSFVMETGYDILFFWVARMIMMGLVNTGRGAFSHGSFSTGLIRDTQGVKMSKTKGNVLDPPSAYRAVRHGRPSDSPSPPARRLVTTCVWVSTSWSPAAISPTSFGTPPASSWPVWRALNPLPLRGGTIYLRLKAARIGGFCTRAEPGCQLGQRLPEGV